MQQIWSLGTEAPWGMTAKPCVAPQKKKKNVQARPEQKKKKRKKNWTIPKIKLEPLGEGLHRDSIPTSIQHCHCPTCTSMAGQASLTMSNPVAQAHLWDGRPPPSSCFLPVGSSGGLVSSSQSLSQSLSPPPLS